jgi:hypothetical protein
MMLNRKHLALCVSGALAPGAFAAPAVAIRGKGSAYVVKSIVLTYTSTATTSAAIGPGGAGTLSISLAGRLTGTTSGGPVRLGRPEVTNEYMCSPVCPGFRANGVVTVTETFQPADPAAPPTTCRTAKRLAKPTSGRVDFAGSAAGTRTFRVRILDVLSANALYLAARDPSCAVPGFVPAIGTDYGLFGTTDGFSSTQIGANTLTLPLKANAIAPANYPWPAQGGTTMQARVVLVKK